MKLKKAIETLTEEIRKEMIKNLEKHDISKDSNLSKSIKYEVEETPTGVTATRSMNFYGSILDQGKGRGPGKLPPVDSIMDYVKRKNIPIPSSMTLEQFSFAIAKGIAKNGTNPKPKPFINNSIEDVFKEKGEQILSDAVLKEIMKEVQDKLKDRQIKL